jgi:hypothetical protein
MLPPHSQSSSRSDGKPPACTPFAPAPWQVAQLARNTEAPASCAKASSSGSDGNRVRSAAASRPIISDRASSTAAMSAATAPRVE